MTIPVPQKLKDERRGGREGLKAVSFLLYVVWLWMMPLAYCPLRQCSEHGKREIESGERRLFPSTVSRPRRRRKSGSAAISSLDINLVLFHYRISPHGQQPRPLLTSILLFLY